jgi:hypothetical protein
MRTLIPAVALFLFNALPAFARDRGTDILQLPEPTTMALLGVGAVGLLVAIKKKKK